MEDKLVNDQSLKWRFGILLHACSHRRKTLMLLRHVKGVGYHSDVLNAAYKAKCLSTNTLESQLPVKWIRAAMCLCLDGAYSHAQYLD